MSAAKKVRIGFCGVGSMGQCAHLKHYATLPDCEVAALAEYRKETAAAVAQRYNIPHVYASLKEMLAAEKLDAIVASQPFTRHGLLLPELLQAGKPIFIEKPLASSVPVGERILAALAATNTFVMVGYHKRSDPATMYAKAEIDRLKAGGEIGQLKYVRICMPSGDWIANGFLDLIDFQDRGDVPLEYDPADPSMTRERFEQYKSFVNFYIHQVNLLRFLMGEDYAVTFADRAGRLLAGETPSGVTCTIEMNPYRTSLDWQESALVAFEKVELPAPLASNRPGRGEVLKDPGEGAGPGVLTPHLPWVGAMRQQAVNFLAAVRGDAAPPCAAAEAQDDLNAAMDYLRLWTQQRGE